MTRTFKHLTALACTAGVLLGSATASAQATEEQAILGFASSYSTLLVTIGTSPLTTTGAIVGIVLTVQKKQSPKALQTYLNNERVVALEAISTGSGEGLTDLATLFQVSPQNHAQFARLLRSHRGELVPLLLGEEISAEQTYEFARIIIDRMREHDALRLDIERAIQRAGG